MICPIAPLSARNSLQSSVLLPTTRSTWSPAPSAIRRMGRSGTTSPSTTGWKGNVLATTSAPHRCGSGCAKTSAFSSV